MTQVEVVTLIRATPESVFDLELDADVHAASMAASGETATTSTGRPTLGLGDEVTFARHFGVPWRLTGRVTEYDRPRRFEAVDGGATRMTDRIAFTAPLGPAGAVVARLVLAPYLRRLLEQRAACVRELAERA